MRNDEPARVGYLRRQVGNPGGRRTRPSPHPQPPTFGRQTHRQLEPNPGQTDAATNQNPPSWVPTTASREPRDASTHRPSPHPQLLPSVAKPTGTQNPTPGNTTPQPTQRPQVGYLQPHPQLPTFGRQTDRQPEPNFGKIDPATDQNPPSWVPTTASREPRRQPNTDLPRTPNHLPSDAKPTGNRNPTPAKSTPPPTITPKLGTYNRKSGTTTPAGHRPPPHPQLPTFRRQTERRAEPNPGKTTPPADPKPPSWVPTNASREPGTRQLTSMARTAPTRYSDPVISTQSSSSASP